MIGTNNAKWNSFKAAISGGAAPAPTPAPKPSTKYNTKPKWVGESTVNGLNVRTGPGTNYSKLAAWPQLGKGNLVDVCDSSGNWYYVRIAAKYYGWVCASYLKKPGSSSTPAAKPSAPAKKSVDTIAREVIAGKWGNGNTRKQKLAAAGYNYSEVQKRVNQLLK